MPATLTLRVFTGADAATMSDAVTGIDFISADNAVNSLGNRQANPVVIPVAGQHYSYEKWLKLRVDVAPDNDITNVMFWGPNSYPDGTEIKVGKTATGATPTDQGSAVADADAKTVAIEADKFDWHAAAMTEVGNATDFLVLQLEAESHASPGNWAQQTFYYSYDET